jgi:hypothetical protein
MLIQLVGSKKAISRRKYKSLDLEWMHMDEDGNK